DGRAVNPLHDRQSTADWPLERDEARREAHDLVATVLEARTRLGDGAPAPLAQDADPWGELIDLLLAGRARSSGAAPGAAPERHRSTSALLSLAHDPDLYRRRRRRPLPAPPARGARAGTAFHSWVERHFAAATLVDV